MGKRGGHEKGIEALLRAADKKRLTNEQCFVENSTYPRHRLKERIIKQNLIPYECEKCGNDGHWLGEKMPLVLDHKNGVNNDNRLKNLRFLCSNCDSILPTYKNRRGNRKVV
ncbi:MAG: hypothetical protein R3182_04590 [Draconibacterium sp.]|nr:hypothetical protein [Draconibacterium sp.]